MPKDTPVDYPESSGGSGEAKAGGWINGAAYYNLKMDWVLLQFRVTVATVDMRVCWGNTISSDWKQIFPQDVDLASINFLKNVYELTSSNLNNTISNNSGIAIGFGIFGDYTYISFDIIWTRLQHRFDTSGSVQTRAKYGNNAWSSWK